MKTYIYNLSVKWKIIFLVAVPFIMLLYISIQDILIQYKTLKSFQSILKLSELSSSISEVVHEWQKERGMTSGFLGSQGKKFKTKLPQQRAVADKKMQALNTFLKSFNAKEYGDEFEKQLLSALKANQKREEIRRNTDALKIKKSDAITYYTSTNGQFLNLISFMTALSTHAEMSQRLSAYFHFLLAKERAGVERAVMTGVFSDGRFSKNNFIKFCSLMSEQKSYLDSFQKISYPDQWSLFEKTLKGPSIKAVEEMRKIALEVNLNTKKKFNVKPEVWFKNITQKINLLKKVDISLASDIKKRSLHLTKSSKNSITILSIILSSILLLSTFLMVLMIKIITAGIRKSVAVAKSMGNGDFTQEIIVEGEDEIGALSQSINQMQQNLKSMIYEIKEITSRLTSSSEEMSSTSMQMQDSTQKTKKQADNVSNATEQMSANINSMASATEEMNVNVSSVSSAAEQMSVNMDSVASAIEEMSATIKNVSKSSREASDVAGKATEMSHTATEKMNLLNSAGQEIGKVTEVIKRIAEQTNLLALNATIEAASAGEAGKGFAVVAGEIKELANQSAQAAEDIAKKIEGVQVNTKDAVDVIQKVTGIITNINESVTTITQVVVQQEQATNEIANNVSESNEGARNIARSIAEVEKGTSDLSQNATQAAKGTSNVSQSIQEVSEAARQGQSGAEQVNSSSSDLAQMSGELQTMIEKFKV